MTPARSPQATQPVYQRGQIALITVLLLGLTITVSLFSLARSRNPTLDDIAQTERALSEAREALIAYASGRPATNRPGELPCPDTNNDGAAEPSCSTLASQIGRLPWATLGIRDLRDGSGERLWYTVSNRFKNSPAVTPLNSNTAGQLTVTGNAPANNVIAIVFAPGTVVAGQSRTAANINNVTHYLDGENANGDTVFSVAAANSGFNDRLLAINSSNFFPAIEMKVARELRIEIRNYFTTNSYLPPGNAHGLNCVPTNLGMIVANPVACGAGHASWPSSLPTWFNSNQWYRSILYAVAPACVNPSAINCSGPGGFLTVINSNTGSSTTGVKALLIAPGVANSGQVRPCTINADCLEPPNITAFPVFTHAPGDASTNDRIIIVAP